MSSVHVEVPGGMKAATSRENSRYALSGIEVRNSHTAGRVYLSATNGRMLAIREAAGFTPGPEIIPAVVLPSGKKTDTITRKNGTWRALEASKIADVDPSPGAFPPCVDVLPDFAGQAGVVAVRLNAHLLSDLAAAISEDGAVVLIIGEGGALGPKLRGLGVLGSASVGGFGVIMPVSGPETDTPAVVERFNAARLQYADAIARPPARPELGAGTGRARGGGRARA